MFIDKIALQTGARGSSLTGARVENSVAVLGYEEKREWLTERHGEELSPADFYSEIFPEGALERPGQPGDCRPNGIITELVPDPHRGPDKALRHLVFDDHKALLDFVGTDRFGLVAPLAYSGKKRDLKHAYTCFGLAFDLDEPNLVKLHWQFGSEMSPWPSHIVLSGHGVHLYYVFETPVPMYPRNKVALRELKRILTPMLWNSDSSAIRKPQHQGINQGFRIVGAASKLGVDYPVRAWRTGPPQDPDEMIDYLVEFTTAVDRSQTQQRVREMFGPAEHTWEEAKALWPEWAACKSGESVTGARRGPRWHVNPGLYEWWRIKGQEAVYGHRYYALMALAVFARKCDIDRAKLEHDINHLVGILTRRTSEYAPLTRNDVHAALQAYDEDYVTMPRRTLQFLTGIDIIPNKRNWRPQDQHIRIVSAIRDTLHPDGSWRYHGGAPTKETVVREWRLANPRGRKIDCERETGLSRPTVLKWWDACMSAG